MEELLKELKELLKCAKSSSPYNLYGEGYKQAEIDILEDVISRCGGAITTEAVKI